MKSIWLIDFSVFVWFEPVMSCFEALPRLKAAWRHIFQCLGLGVDLESWCFGLGLGLGLDLSASILPLPQQHHSNHKQEGQHPVTGQRSANFRILAKQWAERRLVTQWRHGCRAMRRSVCNAGASNVGQSLYVQILREQSYPLSIYWYHSKGNWLRYNFAAKSFYIMKLCSRNCLKDDKFRYFIPILRNIKEHQKIRKLQKNCLKVRTDDLFTFRMWWRHQENTTKQPIEYWVLATDLAKTNRHNYKRRSRLLKHKRVK